MNGDYTVNVGKGGLNISSKWTQYNKTITIQYSQSCKYPPKLGRWFCKKGIGIQSIPRIIRHTICEGYYIDTDFKNARPTILQSLHRHKSKYDHFLYISHYYNLSYFQHILRLYVQQHLHHLK